jgi:hypothetical protein
MVLAAAKPRTPPKAEYSTAGKESETTAIFHRVSSKV